MMNKRNAIFGTGMGAKELKRYMEYEGIKVDFFIVDMAYKKADIYDEIPVVDTDSFFREYSNDMVDVYLGVGMPKMNKLREKLFKEFHDHNFRFATFISKTSLIYTKRIGEGCIVYPGTIVGADTILEQGVMLSLSVTIAHDCIIEAYSFFAAGATVCGDARIGKGSFIGANSTIKNSSKLAEYTLVGASAYVSKNTKPYQVVLPAKSERIKGIDSTYFMSF